MIWCEPSSHDDCYFCLTNVTGINSKNSDKIKYADVRSVTKPVLYEPRDKFPIPPLMKEKEDSNDLVRDLNLAKDKSQRLGSRLKERNLLDPETTFSWYRHRETELVEFISEGKDYVYCSNI